MKVPAPVAILVSLAILLTASPVAAQPTPPQRQAVPIGTGARFLPPTTAAYVAVDLLSNQWEHVHRLAAYYLGAQELADAHGRIGQQTGMSVPEVLQGVQSWAGGEVFVAVPDIGELGRLQGLGGDDDPSLCDGPAVLVGAAIGDLSAFLTFVRRVDAQIGAAPAVLEAPGAAELYEIGRSAAGPLFYVAIRDGFALASSSRQLLAEATSRNQADSLASLPAFAAMQARLGGGSLAYVYGQYDTSQVTSLAGGVVGMPFRPRQAMSQFGARLALTGDSMRVDFSSDAPVEGLGPAARALLAKSPNAVRSASVVPTQSVVFVSWDNVKLAWDAAVEMIFPDRSQYDDLRREAILETGLDPEEDVFGWMTGELGLFVAPTSESDPLLRNLGLGAVLEARDPALAREKIDLMVRAVRRLGGPENQPTNIEIAGLPFQRIPLSGETALYVGLADRWVVLTTSAGLTSEVIGGVRGAGGLDRNEEYRLVRNALGDPVQSVAYVDVPQLVGLVAAAAGPASGQTDELQAALRPIRGVGGATRMSAERSDATLFAHVVVPSEPLARARQAPAEPRRVSALVDASKHGGAWWGPDEEPTLFARPGGQDLPARGRAFARYLRDEAGVDVGRVVGPGGQVALEGASRFAPDSLRGQRLVIRVGSDGAYSEEEIATYREYVRCGGALLLLADGLGPGEVDELAAAFGLEVAGTTDSAAVIDRYAAAMGDLPPLAAPNATGLIGWDDYGDPIAFFAGDSYLDLDGDGRQGADELVGAPAAAAVRYGWGRVAFLGTTSLLDSPEHPLTAVLLGYLLPDD